VPELLLVGLALRAATAAGVLPGLLATSTAPSSPGSSPTLKPGLDPNDVSPGLSGFLATAAVVAISILLIVNLVGRLRRIRHRADLEAREQAEGDARSALGGAPGPDGAAGRDEPPHRGAKGPEHLE
jgi:hypothetical protein